MDVLIAGEKYHGKLKIDSRLLKEVTESDRQINMFINEIHIVVGIGIFLNPR